MADSLQRIASKLYEGEDKQVAELVHDALDYGAAPLEILSSGLIAGMEKVGKDCKRGQMYVPEVLKAARAMRAAMDILRPLLTQNDTTVSTGKCLISTVKGDLHDIGKNLVKMMLDGAGFEVVDLGTNVGPEAFVAAVRQHRPRLLGMSALLTTTMGSMKATIEALTALGLRDSVKIMIGGAPLTAAFAQEIGADAYAPDAGSAVGIARSLVG